MTAIVLLTGCGTNLAGLLREPGVTAYPVVLHAPEPAACSGSKPGNGLVALIVDEKGNPESVELKASSGNACQDRALLDAVRLYRFKPGLSDGEPVATAIQLEVNVNSF